MRASIGYRWCRTWCAAAGLTLAGPPAGVLTAQSVAWTGSLYGATGDYIFTERSTNLALSNGLALTAGRLRLSATIPIVLQTTPWVAMGGAGPVPTGGPMHETVGQQSGMGGYGRRGMRVSLPEAGEISEIGLGDPVVFGGLDLVREGTGTPNISLTGGVKAPIASVDDGFGTGEWDFGAGLGISKAFGYTMLFADATYWVMGDMPGLPLRDVVSYGGAVGRILSGPWSGLLSFSGSQATIEGTDAPMQLGVLVSRRASSGGSVSAGLSFGLTSSAADVSASLGWRVPLGSREEREIIASGRDAPRARVR